MIEFAGRRRTEEAAWSETADVFQESRGKSETAQKNDVLIGTWRIG